MKKFRLFLDKDIEETWLKEMSMKGWAFKNFFLGIYTFEACEPGQYHYQIDLLDNWNGNKYEFSSFMEDSGVEVVAQWYRWVYIRKRASDGPFEMYTDSESKIAQYSRIKNFFFVILLIEIICFGIELMGATQKGDAWMWLLTGLIGILVIALLKVVWKCKWKIEQLKNQGEY